jgi:outer membrane protein, heavy metal efflux system
MNASRSRSAAHWVTGIAIAAALVAAGPGAMAQTAADATLGSNVKALLDFARANSPELGAMRYEAEAAKERVLPAGALPDPVLRVELMNVNNYGTDTPPSLLPSKVGETKYTLMQNFPAWGKRDLRRAVAESDARQAVSRGEAAWVELAAKIKSAYAEYWRAAGNERLTGEVLDLMSRIEQVAQARYAGGQVTQQDSIRAQVEQTAMRSELIAIESEKRQVKARLNALLARDSQAALADPQSPRLIPALSPSDAESLASRARANNPQLQAERSRLASALNNRELTMRNRYPDFQLGVFPSQVGSRITTWGVMVEVNIPFQQETRRSQEREAIAMVDAAQSRSDALANQLTGDLAGQLAALDAARRTESLVRNQLLPQSQFSLQSAQAAYENGKLEFAALLEAHRQIRKARQDLLKVQAEAQIRLADIERIVGEEL